MNGTDDNKMLIVILGPTASGKTEMAIRLAKELGTEIISADSRQVYKELEIGTAAPTAQQMAAVAHHLVRHVSILEDYNVSRFETEAIGVLDELFSRHDKVVMAGGSGLYIDAVCEGFDELPSGDEALRGELRAKLLGQGISALQDELRQLDPVLFNTMDVNNPNRLIRAIEVCRITGKPFSEQRTGTGRERPFRTRKFGLRYERKQLNERIGQRVDRMIEEGLVDETRALLNARDLKALNTVGYSELFEYFDGKMTFEEAVEKIKTHTRRYAKRQMTWFSKYDDIRWIDMEVDSDPVSMILKSL